MTVIKTHPYIADINQSYYRTYVDCEEILKFLHLWRDPDDLDMGEGASWIKHVPEGPIIDVPLTCCPTCAKLGESLEHYKTRAEFHCAIPKLGLIVVKPPAVGGFIYEDWSMNIDAVVCCHHFHLARSLSRDQWLSLVQRVGAKPFVYHPLGSDGNPIRKSGPRSTQGPRVRTKGCLFCANPTSNPEQICDNCMPKG
jgi:hypothetical protein